MAKVYKNFDELISQNSAFFKLLTKNGQTNLLRACWDARNGEVEQFKQQILEFNKAILEFKKTKEEYENKIFLSEGHIRELRAYAESVKEMAESTKIESAGVIDQLKILGEENLEFRMKCKALEDYIETNRNEVEANISHGHKLKELVEAANSLAEEQVKEARLRSEEAAHYKKMAVEKETESGLLKLENETLHKKILEMENAFEESVRSKNVLQEEDEALKRTLFEKEAQLILEEKQSHKFRLEAEEAKLSREQYEVRYLRMESDLTQRLIHIEELEKYVRELREDGAKSKEAAFKTRENVDRLKTYCDDLEIEVERTQKKNSESERYARELENYISVMKEDNEKMKSEIYRLNVVINKIQNSLGQIQPNGNHDNVAGAQARNN